MKIQLSVWRNKMKPRPRKLTWGIFIFLSLVLLLSNLSETVAKRFPFDVSQDIQSQILEIEDTIGIDIYSGIIGKPYSDHMIDVLLGALNNQYVDVKVRSLTMLAEVIKQLDVPTVAMEQKVKPALDLFIKGHISSTDEADILLIWRANRILWQIRIKEISDNKERLEFLKDNIENTTDGFYYSFEAMDYLTNTGSNKARKVLEDKLNEITKRSMPRDIIDKLMVSLDKIKVIQSLEPLNAHSKVKQLRDLIYKQKEEEGTFKRDFLIWLIRRLEKIDSPAAIQTLRDIWQDNTYKDDYRYEVQESLIRLNKIKPEERKVFFQF